MQEVSHGQLILILNKVSIKKSDLPTAWKYKGCFTPTSPEDILFHQSYSSDNLTVNDCLIYCRQGLTWEIAGLLNGNVCVCQSKFWGSPMVIDDGNSTVRACTGSPSIGCGGNNFVVNYGHYSIPKSKLPTGWSWLICGYRFSSHAFGILLVLQHNARHGLHYGMWEMRGFE
ncbi:hypothetical protein BJ742DRAFT_380728 [Cladochytrium replicatum]|nr:hypothetical protein BJ742DRAFT_380728 [Cladochytrium replicatum]